MVGLNSLGHLIVSHLDRRPATGESDPPGIDTSKVHWLLSTAVVSDGGDIDAWIEDSEDNVSFSEIAGSRVSINAQTLSQHQCHTFVVNCHNFRRWVRINFTGTGGSAATTMHSIIINDNTNTDGVPFPADVTTDGLPGGVSEV